MYPEYKWELKNQVFMHVHSPNSLPYQSSKDAIEKFPGKMYSCPCTTTKRGKHGTVRPILEWRISIDIRGTAYPSFFSGQKPYAAV